MVTIFISSMHVNALVVRWSILSNAIMIEWLIVLQLTRFVMDDLLNCVCCCHRLTLSDSVDKYLSKNEI